MSRKKPLIDEENDLLFALGDGVRNRRRASGMTAEELANRSGVALRNVLLLETGTRNPTYLTLRKVAIALDTTVASLLPGETPVDHTAISSQRLNENVKALLEHRGGIESLTRSVMALEKAYLGMSATILGDSIDTSEDTSKSVTGRRLKAKPRTARGTG